MSSANRYILKDELSLRRKTSSKCREMKNFHYHNSYEILFLVKGNKTILFKNGFYELTAGSMILFQPNEIHKTVDNEPYEKIIIYVTDNYIKKHFTGDAKDRIIKCFDNHLLQLQPHDIKQFLYLFDKALLEPKDSDIIFVYIGAILELLSNSMNYDDKTSNLSSSKLTDILNYIADNMTTISSIDDVANKFNITKFHLCRLFHKELDTTVIQYLNAIRVQSMCDNILHSNSNITDIAMQCGFETPRYASRVFKNIMNMTPTEYKQMKIR